MSAAAWTRLPVARAAALLAAWTLGGGLFAFQAYLSRAMRGEPVPWVQALAIWLAWAYAWALLTPAILWLAKRFPFRRGRILRAVLTHTACSGIAAALNLAAFAAVSPLVGGLSTGSTWVETFARLLASTFFLDLPVYWLLVGGAETVRLARSASERERRALRLEAQLAEARLAALRAQIQPHFLFNTLNTISVLMHENVAAADRMLGLLSGLLRQALATEAAHEVPLREELAFLETYLQIEQTRFADRLSYRLDVDPGLLEAPVPSLVLQPLVENAIRHGVARRAAPGEVVVSAARRDGRLYLAVRDDGPGMAPDAAVGLGLSNTRARLEQLYGAEHTLKLVAAEGGGLIVSLAIPLRGPSR